MHMRTWNKNLARLLLFVSCIEFSSYPLSSQRVMSRTSSAIWRASTTVARQTAIQSWCVVVWVGGRVSTWCTLLTHILTRVTLYCMAVTLSQTSSLKV